MRHKVTTELRYPGLWRGCVGAWNPGLGPSGLTLRDWSGRGNHGTLTNMDAGTDWVSSQGRYALDFDGSNDCVVLPSTVLTSGSPFSLTWWEYVTVDSGAFSGRFSFNMRGTANRFVVIRPKDQLAYGSLSWGPAPGDPSASESNASSTTQALNKWRFFAITGSNPNGSFVTGGYRLYEGGIAEAVTQKTVKQGSTFTTIPAATSQIGDYGASAGTNALLTDMRIYDRILPPAEVSLCGFRRGIAYELAPRRRASVAVAGGGFKAAWIPRRSLVIGGGTN